MTKYRVILSPRADDQLAAIYLYVAAEASPQVALRFVDAIVEKCNSLCDFPKRGTPRDDVRRGCAHWRSAAA